MALAQHTFLARGGLAARTLRADFQEHGFRLPMIGNNDFFPRFDGLQEFGGMCFQRSDVGKAHGLLLVRVTPLYRNGVTSATVDLACMRPSTSQYQVSVR